MRRDSLNEKLAHRPDPEALLKEGVLHEDPRSPETKAAEAEADKEVATERQEKNNNKYEQAMEDEYAKREGGA